LQSVQVERLQLEQGWTKATYNSPIRGLCDRVQDMASYAKEYGSHIDIPANNQTSAQYVSGQKAPLEAKSL
jgi:hypothetical protein